MASGSQAPTLDENKLYERGTVVYWETFCACGDLRRVRGPIEQVLEFKRDFEHKHSLIDPSGKKVGEKPGHGPVTKVECCRARESARKAAFAKGQERGDIPSKAKYEPTDWDSKNIGVTNEEVYA